MPESLMRQGDPREGFAELEDYGSLHGSTPFVAFLSLLRVLSWDRSCSFADIRTSYYPVNLMESLS